jgi:hypothetical protein
MGSSTLTRAASSRASLHPTAKENDIAIGMVGKGRSRKNVFVILDKDQLKSGLPAGLRVGAQHKRFPGKVHQILQPTNPLQPEVKVRLNR